MILCIFADVDPKRVHYAEPVAFHQQLCPKTDGLFTNNARLM